MRNKQTEKKLIEAAKTILAHDRIEELSIRNICRTAGCSTSTFYQYFDSKNDLLLALFVYDDREISIDASARNPAENILKLSLFSARQLSALTPAVLKNVLVPTNTSLSAAFFGNTERGKWLVTETARQFERGEEQHIFRCGETQTVQRGMTALLYGYLFDWTISDGGYDVMAQIESSFIRYLNTYLCPDYRLAETEGQDPLPDPAQR